MKLKHKKATMLATSLTTFGLLTGAAQAAVSLNIIESSSSVLRFTVTGDFSGYSPPTSSVTMLFLVPVDLNGDFLTNWTTIQQTNLPQPAGQIGAGTVNGWGIIDHTRADEYGFLAGDSFAVYFGAPITPASSFSTPLSVDGTAFTLNTSDIAGFELYWGRETLLVSTVPEPSSALLFGLGALGLVAHRRRLR